MPHLSPPALAFTQLPSVMELAYSDGAWVWLKNPGTRQVELGRASLMQEPQWP